MKSTIYLLVPSPLEFVVLLWACLLFLYGLRDAQTRPHHRVVTLAGRVISDEWLTNNCEVLCTATNILTLSGYKSVLLYQTNELWPVWSIFK